MCTRKCNVHIPVAINADVVVSTATSGSMSRMAATASGTLSEEDAIKHGRTVPAPERDSGKRPLRRSEVKNTCRRRSTRGPSDRPTASRRVASPRSRVHPTQRDLRKRGIAGGGMPTALDVHTK